MAPAHLPKHIQTPIGNLSTPDSIFVVFDIGSFYLDTLLEQPEYARIAAKYLPDTVLEKYNLHPITSNDGYIYMEINKGMYGLPQAGRLANDLLRKRLAPHGFYECTHTPGYWRHKSRNTKFCLWVDNFGVGGSRLDIEHLTDILQQ